MIEIKLEIKLELKKEEGDEVFYRYRAGDYKFWFTQKQSGDIFAVYACNDKDKCFDLYIDVCEEADFWYPKKYYMRCTTPRMTTTEASVYMQKMSEACAALEAIQNFFETRMINSAMLEDDD